MSRMATGTVVFLFESFLFRTTTSSMVVFCVGQLLACLRIVVLATVLLSTVPTPRFATPEANVKFVLFIETTGKNIGASIILQTPALAPGTLFRKMFLRNWLVSKTFLEITLFRVIQTHFSSLQMSFFEDNVYDKEVCTYPLLLLPLVQLYLYIDN